MYNRGIVFNQLNATPSVGYTHTNTSYDSLWSLCIIDFRYNQLTSRKIISLKTDIHTQTLTHLSYLLTYGWHAHCVSGILLWPTISVNCVWSPL